MLQTKESNPPYHLQFRVLLAMKCQLKEPTRFSIPYRQWSVFASIASDICSPALCPAIRPHWPATEPVTGTRWTIAFHPLTRTSPEQDLLSNCFQFLISPNWIQWNSKFFPSFQTRTKRTSLIQIDQRQRAACFSDDYRQSMLVKHFDKQWGLLSRIEIRGDKESLLRTRCQEVVKEMWEM